MSQKPTYIQVGPHTVRYYQYGNNSAKNIIAFHGFGDTADMFEVLSPALDNRATLYSVTLPFHHGTTWQDSTYTPEDIVEIINCLAANEQLESIELMGYSFGGRICMRVLPLLNLPVDALWLIAPDGIRTNWIFNLAKLPRFAQVIWIAAIKRPNVALRLISSAYRIGFISKFIHDFAHYHVSNEDRRARILGTWLSISSFDIKPPKVKAVIHAKGIPLYLIFGTRDEVIKPSAGQYMAKDVPTAHLYYIEEGHLLVDHKLTQLIIEEDLLGNSPTPQKII